MKLRLGMLLGLLLAAVAPVAARAEMKKDIVFAKPEGVELTLDASVPEGTGPFPTAILVHGGGFTGGTKTSFITPLFEPLTRAGFTWFTINYRLAPKYRYPDCVEDVETAIRWVKDHAKEYKVDVNRIALIGESAGGHLVSLVGARGKGATRVAAVVPFYGPHDMEYQSDWKHALPSSLQALYGRPAELNDETRKILLESSPSTYVRPGLPPYLLIHGTADEQVPYDQSVRFREKMLLVGNTCDLLTIPGGRHGMGSWDQAHPEYKPIMIEWLRHQLSP
jgi:alpha-L-fucosidase 2